MTASYSFGTRKFIPRPLMPHLLMRERLFSLVRGDQPARLLLLHAPPGFGKTTLLSQWHQHFAQRGEGVAWITIDENDNDVGRFGGAIIEALERRGVPRRDDLFDCVGAALDRWSSLTMFLDEAELLTDSDAIHLLTVMLDLWPEGLRLVVGSRAVHAALSTYIKLRGTGMELGAAQLAFDREEVDRYVENRGLGHLQKGFRDDLSQRTEGWPAAVQLALAAVGQGGRSEGVVEGLASPRADLFQYLGEEVLRRESPDTREFLLDTAFLSELSPSLCAAVTGREDAVGRLAELARQVLLVLPVDDSRSLYRYHPLFAECLQNHLRLRAPERIRQLGQRAAHWCLGEGRWEEAVDQCVLVGDLDQAVGILGQRADEAIARHEFATLNRWLLAIPPALLDDRPDLLLSAARIYLHDEKFREAESVVARADEVLAARGEVPANSRIRHYTVRALIHILHRRFDQALEDLRSAQALAVPDDLPLQLRLIGVKVVLAQARGSYAEVHESVRDALGRLPSQQRFWGTIAYGTSLSGMAHLSQGNLDAARVVLGFHEQELDAAREGSANLPAARAALTILAGPRAFILYEQNQLDEANVFLERHRPFLKTLFFPSCLVLWYLLRARTSLALGDATGQHDALDQLEHYALRHGIEWMQRWASWERVAGQLSVGDIERAGAIAEGLWDVEDGATPSRWLPFCDDLFDPVVGGIRFRIHAGDGAQVLDPLEVHLLHAGLQGRWLRHTKLTVLKSMALSAVGRKPEADEAMTSALRQGRRQGLRRSFLDEGPRCLAVLRGLPAGDAGESIDALNAYRLQLLASFEGPDAFLPAMATNRPGPSGVFELTGREVAILGLLAQGHSNSAMATQLNLSANTVKWYLAQLYSKLQVSSRTQAVHVARQQGLLVT